MEYGLSSVSVLTYNSNPDTKINVVSLDSFLNKQISNVKNKKILVKIDTEGTEADVIKGMKNLIEANHVDIFIEINDGNLSKFKDIFNNYNMIQFGRNYFFTK